LDLLGCLDFHALKILAQENPCAEFLSAGFRRRRIHAQKILAQENPCTVWFSLRLGNQRLGIHALIISAHSVVPFISAGFSIQIGGRKKNQKKSPSGLFPTGFGTFLELTRFRPKKRPASFLTGGPFNYFK
jgi:hypothetical protein